MMSFCPSQSYSREKSEKKPYFERPGGWHCKSWENDGALFGWTPIVSEREAKAGKRLPRPLNILSSSGRKLHPWIRSILLNFYRPESDHGIAGYPCH